jgi:hypothetical protein
MAGINQRRLISAMTRAHRLLVATLRNWGGAAYALLVKRGANAGRDWVETLWRQGEP